MNTATMTIDALIQRELPAARSGDHGAYGRIVAACQNTVTAVALAITRDVATSEDIAQEAFLSAWQHLEKLHSPDSFLPWLRQITRNLARDHLHKYRHQPLDGPNAELAMALAADPGPQPMQQLLEGEREMTATELIAALPEDSRETLLLFYREGQSSQQVAALLGTTDAAVRKRLSRARQLVRDDMLKRFGEFAHSSAPSATFTAAVLTTLGVAAKPATAASAAAIGTAALGGGLATKGLVALFGTSSIVAFSFIATTIVGRLTQKHALVFADTLEEREAILRRYWRDAYIVTALVTAPILLAMWVPGFIWTLTAALAAQFVTWLLYWRGRRILQPMMARDAARDPAGSESRQRTYNSFYGPRSAVLSGVFYVGSMSLFYLSTNYGHIASAAFVKFMSRVLQ